MPNKIKNSFVDIDNEYKRIIAYFDIIGFKNLTNHLNNHNDFESIKPILETFKSYTEPKQSFPNNYINLSQKRNYSMFSDNIVLSFNIDLESGIYFIIKDILNTIINLITKNVLIRGSVVCDKIYHDDKYVFGPGLIRAIELEKYANYPRVIVENDVIEIAKKYPSFLNSSKIEELMITDMLYRDLDGLQYIDYFNLVEDSLENSGLNMESYYESLYKTIVDIKPSNDISLFMKYNWLAQKYNDGITNITEFYDCNFTRID